MSRDLARVERVSEEVTSVSDWTCETFLITRRGLVMRRLVVRLLSTGRRCDYGWLPYERVSLPIDPTEIVERWVAGMVARGFELVG